MAFCASVTSYVTRLWLVVCGLWYDETMLANKIKISRNQPDYYLDDNNPWNTRPSGTNKYFGINFFEHQSKLDRGVKWMLLNSCDLVCTETKTSFKLENVLLNSCWDLPKQTWRPYRYQFCLWCCFWECYLILFRQKDSFYFRHNKVQKTFSHSIYFVKSSIETFCFVYHFPSGSNCNQFSHHKLRCPVSPQVYSLSFKSY